MKLFLITLAYLTLTNFSLLGFDQSHSKFTQIINQNATPSGVKYQELEKQRSNLEAYLKDLADVSSKEFKTWDQNEQLAFAINLYNASTLELVLEHYPIKSFKDDVGGKDGPWKLPAVNMFGKKRSLDYLEHEFIRKDYKEPRVHFALNCASEGCPPLRNEAFTGKKLEQQLDEQTRQFLANKKVNKVSAKSIKVSPLFDWFKADFIAKAGSVEAFIDPYFPDIKIKKGKISYTDYGWALNEAK
ncbi:MAG: DUF547 domain-containing protein [Akkermansiaceae bacterium]